MTRFNRSAHWHVPEPHSVLARDLAEGVHCSLPFARLLLIRGNGDHETARRFLYPSYNDIHSHKLLKDAETAAVLVLRAIAGGCPILVYGDFDTDGIMATVIMRTALEFAGAHVLTYIPDRLSEGHGMRPEVVCRFATEGVRTIVTVDQGTGSHEAAACAKQLGLTVIVTDHHRVQAELPVADAIVNPNQPGCNYPNKAICGSGIAWQVARALLETCCLNRLRQERLLRALLKLAAIASIADVVPLVGENRALVRLGLEALKEHQNLGLRMLFAKAGIREGWPPSSHSIAFRVAPRINAANRMAHANLVLDLLAAKDETTAAGIVSTLDDLNNARREAEHRAVEDICSVIERFPTQRAEVIVGWGWPAGINGIIASRLVEQLGVPVFVMQSDHAGVVRGSGRSVAGFDLMEALDAMQELFLHYGGHAQAAGVALTSDHVADFRRSLQILAARSPVPARTVTTDGRLETEELSPQLKADLELLEPTGQENPPARFVVQGVVRIAGDTTMLEHNGRTLELRGVEGVGLRRHAGSNLVCRVDLLARYRPDFVGIVRDWELCSGLEEFETNK